MRKSLQQKVALFLSFSMAFTSIDSSVLVSAADVTGVVSEESHDHAAEETKADVKEQTSLAETAMSEPEEPEDTETLVQMDDSESEGEQIVGEETDEESENSSVDTAGPDQSAEGAESSGESAETVTITRITGTSEME